MFVRPLSSFVRLPLLSPEGEGGGGGNQSTDPAKPEDANPGEQGDAGKTRVEFSDEQMAELGRIVAKERKEAERKAIDKAKADADAAAEQARKDRERDEEIKRGEFDKARSSLESERDAAKGEATSLKAENDQLRAAVDSILTAEWKALPAEVRDAYSGADDDPLAKLAWLPKGKKLAEKLTGSNSGGNRAGPKPGGDGAPEITSLVSGRQLLG